MNFRESVPRDACNEEIQEDDDAISLLSQNAGGDKNGDSDEVRRLERSREDLHRGEPYGGEGTSPRKKEKECSKRDADGIDSKLGFDITNVLTHAYLPVCIEKMKEGEYVYKWNSNNIFQKKTLKFFYLDVNNYCIRWNSKKKKVKENKNPTLYIWDMIKILDGSESSFFKKKEEEKNLSIEIISSQRNLKITFLDIQRWKMWLFGLMYYQYKFINKGSGKKKMKSFICESNKLYDNYIISGLKDINALTLSQLYIILRSLNIYLNMKILYHYFSIYKNKGTVNYVGFTKILEHIFSNKHITTHFDMYKRKDSSCIDNRNFIEFLIDVQCEGKCEERIFNARYVDRQFFVHAGMCGKKGVHALSSMCVTLNGGDNTGGVVPLAMDPTPSGGTKNAENDTEQTHQKKKEKGENNPSGEANSIGKHKPRGEIVAGNSVKNDFCNYQWGGTSIKNMNKGGVNQNDFHFGMDTLPNALLLPDNWMCQDEDYITVLNILREKLGFGTEKREGGSNGDGFATDGGYHSDGFSGNKRWDRANSRRDYRSGHRSDSGDNTKVNSRYGGECADTTQEHQRSAQNESYYIRAKAIYKLVNTIKKYNIPFVMINEDKHYLTQIGLVYFLLSKENSIMCPEYSKVYQNMNLPLCNYWINSSHNTYLGRKQIFSSSNIEQYIYILIDGCRCVEFDCYYFNKNIVVYHGFYGYKLTSSILFCDTLIACKLFGFTTSPFPIILSLEIHCKNKHKNLIAKILICILGNQLYIPKSKDEINNITPENCRNRFLVKYKHFENNDNSGFYFIFEGLQSVMYDELGYISDIVGDDDEDEEEQDGPLEGVHNLLRGSSGESGDSDNSDENKVETNEDCHAQRNHNRRERRNPNHCDDDDIEKQFDSYIKNSIQKGYIHERKKRSIYLSSLCHDPDAVEKDQRDDSPHSDDNPQVVKGTKLSRHKKGKGHSRSSTRGKDDNKPRNSPPNGIPKEEEHADGGVPPPGSQRILNEIPEEGKKKTENKNARNNNILNEYSCLKGYTFQNFCENRTYNEICSISENKFIKLIKKNEEEIIKYNQKTLTRVYPSGTRLASTNFNPLIFWSAGIQFVALNYQYNGLSMLLNKGRFLENGGKHSGYILKPEILRFNEKKDYNILHLDLQILSLHQINLLFSIKNKYQEKKLKKKLFKMDMIQRIQTHKKINKKMKNFKDVQKLEKEKKKFFFSDVQSDDNKKKKNISHEFLMKKFNDNDNDVNYIHNKCLNVEEKYEDMLSEYKSFLLCSSLSHSSSFNSCSSNTTTSNNATTDSTKDNSSKSKNTSFYQTFEELKKANNLFFYLYVTISVHGYNEHKYYFKTEIAKVNFYDLNYCWSKPSIFQMKIMYPSLALIVFELKTYDTVKSELIACACFPVKCLREGIRFVPLCDKYLKDIKGSGILVNLKIGANGN
ncbi:phospholipase C-like protein [Plasmodium inui San Antonio 1]|uniref:Phosphoinositide phospholipase C n=1 Tax=Plasmodium inui San Antonio 1 TaxID=1237626 RepID=W7A2I0_9APIC|nr:phospholipase C-like protein [Plasmodium inui San Antonio 1]EUD67432.1 phospholipase C-like protein [Plasmodium inui San Antonio 1]